jgi:ribosome-associated protein
MKKVIKVKAIKKEERVIKIDPPFIKLDSLLKLCDIAQTGGHAKILIQDGLVEVNGEICDQRGRKIKAGDKIRFEDTVWSVEEK